MKALIITVAGESTRFRKTLGKDVLKCIYSENDFKKTILNYQLSQADDFDKVIVVGGYKHDELVDFIKTNYDDDRIVCLFNDKYNTYGSGYSLYIAIDYLRQFSVDEIVFCEGDLYFDSSSFDKIKLSENSVITANLEAILAKKAVAFYSTLNNEVRYIYDTEHKKLQINEPFTAIYNSGQVWKFVKQDVLNGVLDNLMQEQMEGTNLEIIEGYFSIVTDYSVVQFQQWINCNTADDYELIVKQIKG